MDTPESTYERIISNHKSLEIVPVPTQSAPRSFAKYDRVRHIGGAVQGTVQQPPDIDTPHLILVRWDDWDHAYTTRVDKIELSPVPTPHEPTPPEPEPPRMCSVDLCTREPHDDDAHEWLT